MAMGRFVVYTAIGSTVWNTALIGAGYLLRARWDEVEPILSWFQYIVLAGVVVALGWFIRTRRRSGFAAKADAVTTPPVGGREDHGHNGIDDERSVHDHAGGTP